MSTSTTSTTITTAPTTAFCDFALLPPPPSAGQRGDGGGGGVSMPLSAAERLERVRDLHDRFRRHVRETRGMALSRRVRGAIAGAARRALTCRACRAGTMSGHDVDDNTTTTTMTGDRSQNEVDACGRSELWRVPHDGLVELPQDEDRDHDDDDDEHHHTRQVLTAVIHAIVHHPTRWEEDTSELQNALHDILLPHESKTHNLTASLWAEVVALTTLSHGLYVTFASMNRPAPALPDATTYNNGNDSDKKKRRDRKPRRIDLTPRGLNMERMIIQHNNNHKEQSSWDATVGTVWTCRRMQPQPPVLDTNRLETEFSPRVVEVVRHRILRQPSAVRGLIMSPDDACMVWEFLNVCYMDASQITTPWLGLDPSQHCSDVFTRRDKHIVGRVVADRYQCAAMGEVQRKLEQHGTLPSRRRVYSISPEERQTVLQEFAGAVAARPWNARHVKSVAAAVRSRLGEGALVEAAATVGAMEVETRLVTLLGQQSQQASILSHVDFGAKVHGVFGWMSPHLFYY